MRVAPAGLERNAARQHVRAPSLGQAEKLVATQRLRPVAKADTKCEGRRQVYCAIIPVSRIDWLNVQALSTIQEGTAGEI
jgi:hypothetical protein